MPDGELGEIWVRGEQVSGEYLGVDPSSVDGWFNTRDSGRLDGEGYLFVHGRLDDVIVRGGENLSPGEIETVLLEHPAVEAAAVVGIPDIEWGEQVVAAVVLQPGAVADEAELQDHVRAALRSACTPERIKLTDRASVQRDRQAPAPRPARRAGRRVRPRSELAAAPRRGEGLGVELLELDLAGQHRLLPRLVLGLVVVELRHHLVGEQLEAGADVLVGVLAGLVEQDHLVDVRLLEPVQALADRVG